ENVARELLQEIVLFVGGAGGADDADGGAALRVADLLQAIGSSGERFFPTDGDETTVLADQRLAQSVFVGGEVEGVGSLDAEEVAVDAALIAIVAADDLHAVVGAAHAERGLAAIGTVRAGGGDVVHLPRAGLITVGAGGERADRADVDAHAALFAVQMVA